MPGSELPGNEAHALGTGAQDAEGRDRKCRSWESAPACAWTRCEQTQPTTSKHQLRRGAWRRGGWENNLLCLRNMLIAPIVTIELFHFCN